MKTLNESKTISASAEERQTPKQLHQLLATGRLQWQDLSDYEKDIFHDGDHVVRHSGMRSHIL